jgi:phage gpG-like protein
MGCGYGYDRQALSEGAALLKFTVDVDPNSSGLAMLNTMQAKTNEAFQLRANVSMRMRVAVLKNFEASGRPSWTPRRTSQPWKLLWHTGNLVGSFHDRVQGESAEVYTQTVYAAIHQFGGKIAPRVIKPRNAKALRFTIGGTTIFAKSVNWPGANVPARPFMSMIPAEEDEIAAMIFDYVEGIK